MGKYLHLFEGTASTEAHDELYNGSGYTEPWVAYIEETDSMSWNKAHGVEYDVCEYYGLLNLRNAKAINLSRFPSPDASFDLFNGIDGNGGFDPGSGYQRGESSKGGDTKDKVVCPSTYFYYGTIVDDGGDNGEIKGSFEKGGAKGEEETPAYYYMSNNDGNEVPILMNSIDDVNDIINNVIIPGLDACADGYDWRENLSYDVICQCEMVAVYDADADVGFTKTKLGDMPRESWGEFYAIADDNIESLYESDGNGYTYFDITLVDSKNCTDAMTYNFRYNHLEETYEGYNVKDDYWEDIGVSKLGELMSQLSNFCYFYIGSSGQNNETPSNMSAVTMNILNNNVYIIQPSSSDDDDNPVTPFDPGEMTIEN